MKTVAMIPVRMGSKRIPKKNIRLLNGKPLVAYIIEAAKAANCFDEIYLNSEDELFRDIADDYGIKFYHRPAEYATDTATNDDFAYDFMKNVECDTVIQLLATSPFLTMNDVLDFVASINQYKWETLISVNNIQIECVFDNKPVNFSIWKKTAPSQSLKPVKAYACALMGWSTKKFMDIYTSEFGGAYHGRMGKTGYHTLCGLATIDIDNEEDFLLAEKIMQAQSALHTSEPQYYQKAGRVNRISGIEADVPSILEKDGVENNDLFDANKEIISIPAIINKKRFNADNDSSYQKSWSKRVVDTESNSATLICQLPGEGNRRHYHHNWNEWWYIMQGEWDFEIEGEVKRVKEGDLVFIAKNRVHKIQAAGTQPAIRLAVSRADVEHVYVQQDELSAFKSVNEQQHIWSKRLQNGSLLDFAGAFEWGGVNDSEAKNKSGSVLGDYRKIKTEYLLPNIQGKTVIDLGCYSGKWTEQMLTAKKVIAVDITVHSFEYIKTMIAESFNGMPEFEFYKTKGDELSGIPDQSVDFIFSMDSLVRSEKQILEAYIKEFKRVLKPDGKTCVHFPCEEQHLSWELGFTQFNREQLHTMVQDAGFTNYRLDYETIKHGILLLINL